MIREELDVALAGATRVRRKRLLRVALSTLVGFAGFVALVVGSTLLGQLTRSDDTAEVFNEAAELPPALIDATIWTPDRDDLARFVDPITRDDLTRSWLRAWSAITVLAETGDRSAIEASFSNDALRAVESAAYEPGAAPIRQISHELTIEFFSIDGQVAEVSVASAFLRGERFDDDVRWLLTDEHHRALLLLEDGNWRIQHLIRESIDGRWATGDLGGTDSAIDTIRSLPAVGPALDSAPETLAFDDSTVDGSVVLRPFGDRPPGLPSSWSADLEHLDAVHAAMPTGEIAALELGTLSANADGLAEVWAYVMAEHWRSLDSDVPIVLAWSTIDDGAYSHFQVDGQSITVDGMTTIAPDAEALARVQARPLPVGGIVAATLLAVVVGALLRRRRLRPTI